MVKKHEMAELRERLDKTLASPDLLYEESVKSLVRNQLLRSPFSGTEGDLINIVEKRTSDVLNFLEMLRSVSVNETDTYKSRGVSHNEWKVKQDTDQLRVMYREGPHGTPFHTLLAEGQVDGPVDICLCVSWESALYKKWWPQYNIPTFKIVMSSSLQKVRIGEEISLVRVKVPWPVSDREALLHYYEIEYFKDDLILVLINSISGAENIDVCTHGFSKDGIPEATDIVRVDMVGGFVLQKVSSNKSYFRTIANLDIKLDFIPPSLINFISRQLIGNGYKLYYKAVGTVGTNDEDYRQALKGLMYTRIRDRLQTSNKHKILSSSLSDEETSHLPEKKRVETSNAVSPIPDATSVTEIVEEADQNPSLKRNKLCNGSAANPFPEQYVVRKGAFISPEVEHALDILDRAIAIVRGCGSYDGHHTQSSSYLDYPTPETFAEQRSIGEDDPPAVSNTVGITTNLASGGLSSENSRDSGLDSMSVQVNGSEQSLLLKSSLAVGYKQEDNLRISSNKKPIEAGVTMRQPLVVDSMNKVCNERSLTVNGSCGISSGGSGKTEKTEKRRRRICCFRVGLS